MSLGWVAMQCSLAPKIAWSRLMPPIAWQPLPGSRLLQGIGRVVRNSSQRVRCSRLPPVVALLRSCPLAPARSARRQDGIVPPHSRIGGEIAVAHHRTDTQPALGRLFDPVEIPGG